MAKNVSYRGKKEIDPAEGKIPYDPSVWQPREGSDYIHTLTGEIRTEEQFDWDASPNAGGGELSDTADEDGGSTSGGNDWDDVSQDAMGDDFVAPQVKLGNSSSGDTPDGKSKVGAKSKTKKR